jgi:hypothetical protein
VRFFFIPVYFKLSEVQRVAYVKLIYTGGKVLI